MIILTNNKTTKFCQIILHVKRFTHKRKVVHFFLPHGVAIKMILLKHLKYLRNFNRHFFIQRMVLEAVNLCIRVVRPSVRASTVPGRCR